MADAGVPRGGHNNEMHSGTLDIDDFLEGREVDQAAAEKIEAWYQRTGHKRHMPVAPLDTWWKD